MTVVRNWRDATPHVGHESVIIHYILGEKAEGKTYEEAPIEGEWSLTRHAIQGGKEGDYHVHDAAEQVFYFTKGTGQMKIDDKLYDLDFWLNAKAGKLEVTEEKIHKHPENKGGKWVKVARYTFVNDKPVEVK